MGIEDRVLKVEERVDRGEDRTKLIEQAIIQMRDLVIGHDERLEDYFRALRESRADFEFKMNALVDAQIKNETEIAELKQSSIELRIASQELRIASHELRIASQSQLQRIEKLEIA